MPEQPDFDITVAMLTTGDQLHETAPQWAELTLAISGGEHADVDLPLTRRAGEVIIDCLHEGLHPWAGRSIVEQLEDKLDEVYSRLMDKTTNIDKGRCQGLAHSIATMRNPYQPDIDQARYEAHARWEEKQKED